jgi:hypothetical protein
LADGLIQPINSGIILLQHKMSGQN